MLHGVTIRAARPDEYQAVGELTATAYAPVLAQANDDPYLPILRDASSRARAAELLVAVDDAELLLGTVTIGRPGSPYAQLATPTEVEVRMLAVAPEYARRGIGERLMTEVHTIASHESFTGMVLSVISTNTAAAAFYRSLGYVRAPDRDWHPVPDQDVLLEAFARSVTTGPAAQ